MDVVCGRCRAEYEFDDALISERGTTVRCTNCGLQFKVFPPVGRRSPEVWRVFNPAEADAEPTNYESLAQLQRAISLGEVTAAFKLVRGDEEPRLLAEIVELQPLLRQPRSEQPPPVHEDSSELGFPDALGVSAPPSFPGRSKRRTALGMEVRPDPASRHAKAPPRFEEANDEVRDEEDDEEAIVPATPEPPEELATTDRSGSPSHPKIRSVLSFTSSEDVPPPSSGREGRASIVPRTSLRSTLSGTYSSGQRSERASSPGPESLIPPELAAAIVSPHAAAAHAAAAHAAAPHAAAPEKTVPSAASRIRMPSEPEFSEAPESIGGNRTPTPSAMRAYQTVDSEPVSARPNMPAPRRARSAFLVIVVLVGGGLFVALSNRDKIGEMIGSSSRVAEPSEAGVSEQLSRRLEEVELEWMRKAFFGKGQGVGATESLAAELAASGGESSWAMVNLKRAGGDLQNARLIASKLGSGGDAAFSRALLDYAEAPADPPWPVILDHLREAAAGERGVYLARTAYIFALGSSGNARRAKGDFEAFSRLTGAKQAPLFHELEQFVRELSEEMDSGSDKRPGAVGPDAVAPASRETAPPQVTPQDSTALTNPEKTESPPVEPEAPEETSEPESQSSARAKQVSKAIQDKVTRADSLWRGGDREGALVLYHQVVSTIGTSHFLGQRSAARIRQAEREKSGVN